MIKKIELVKSNIEIIKNCSFKTIDIYLKEFLNNKQYDNFLYFILAYVIYSTINIKKDINIKRNRVLSGFIATQFNEIYINDKSVLNILDQLELLGFKYDFKELTTITNKIRKEF